MSLGTQFLNRINEAKEFKFDSGVETMKRGLRDVSGEDDLADKIVEVAAMCGVSGRFMNTSAGRASVLGGANSLKLKPASVQAFLSLHSKLSSFHNVFMEDVEETDGTMFQQLVSSVLMSLGVPKELLNIDAKSVLKNNFKRVVMQLSSDAEVRKAFKMLGAKLKVGAGAGFTKMKEISEDVYKEVDVEERMNTPVLMAKALMKVLGVDFKNDSIFTGDNMSKLDRQIKVATRDPIVRRAMNQFLRVTE
jgi:hypothetical protein